MGACRAYLEPAGYEAVRTALASGHYAEAESLAGASVVRAEVRDGRESLPLAAAIDWLVRARLKNGRAADAVTFDLAIRAVRLKERRLGRSSPEAAASIHNLAVVHSQRGEFQTALRLHEEVLASRKAALGTDDPAVAESLEELAVVLIQLERFPEAERRLADAQRIRERRSAESPIELARALELNRAPPSLFRKLFGCGCGNRSGARHPQSSLAQSPRHCGGLAGSWRRPSALGRHSERAADLDVRSGPCRKNVAS